ACDGGRRSNFRVVAAFRTWILVFVPAEHEAVGGLDDLSLVHRCSTFPANLEIVGHARLVAMRTRHERSEGRLAVRAVSGAAGDRVSAAAAGPLAEALIDGGDRAWRG